MRNSFDAHRLLTWAGALEEPDQAAATGVQTALKLALFRAHFTDNRDVGDPAVLVDVAASVGLDAARAAAILDGDDYAEMVRMEEAYWADNNVTGVPAFILGGRMPDSWRTGSRSLYSGHRKQGAGDRRLRNCTRRTRVFHPFPPHRLLGPIGAIMEMVRCPLPRRRRPRNGQPRTG